MKPLFGDRVSVNITFIDEEMPVPIANLSVNVYVDGMYKMQMFTNQYGRIFVKDQIELKLNQMFKVEVAETQRYQAKTTEFVLRKEETNKILTVAPKN